MPSRRQIRETTIQFLYCSDLEGGVDPAGLRGPFWDFITESDRRQLQLATFRTVHHLAHGREQRLGELVARSEAAMAHLAARPEAERLKGYLEKLLGLESAWSMAFSRLERLPKNDDSAALTEELEATLGELFKVDRDLVFFRSEFLKTVEDFPALRSQLENVSAPIRRLQRISDRLRMVEEPEKFPDQADLSKIRQSRTEIAELRRRTDELVDAVLAAKEEVDGKIVSLVENYSPERIDPIDRAILRLGGYELMSTDTPAKVVINEAIELAKRFSTTDSRRFVNGILDKFAGLEGKGRDAAASSLESG